MISVGSQVIFAKSHTLSELHGDESFPVISDTFEVACCRCRHCPKNMTALVTILYRGLEFDFALTDLEEVQ